MDCWSQKIGTEIALKCRRKRRGKAGEQWHMDVTYLQDHRGIKVALSTDERI